MLGPGPYAGNDYLRTDFPESDESPFLSLHADYVCSSLIADGIESMEMPDGARGTSSLSIDCGTEKNKYVF